MKITAIILLSACLQVSAKGHGQSITLSEKNASLEKIFSEIKKQSDYTFAYTESLLSKAKKVSITIKDGTLEEVLNLCFSNQPFTYTIIEKTIVVKPATVTPDLDLGSLPPPIDIKGRVINESGEPVAASIVVKGTNNGTTSNEDGYFELKGVDENATLVITGVSIETREIKVRGETDLVIVTKTAVKPLEETIIKGYYTTTKRLNTGNVSKIDAATIEKQPIANPLQALQGRMPGVSIQQFTGVPGGAFAIRIRGQNSLRRNFGNDGNLPLYIIDGVPFTSTSITSVNTSQAILQGGNPLSAINPTDIESIEVLKDADATAIYGSRGANGVVLITTKKGKAGKTKIDINTYSGIGKVANTMDLLNTQQYLEMRNEAFANDGATPQSWNHDVNGAWDNSRYTDWQKVLIGGTANITNANISISGGSANTQFFIGGGYYKETLVFPGDFAFQKGSGHFNINHISENGKLKANLTSTYVSENNNYISGDLTYTAINLAPNAPPLYSADGTLNWQNGTWTNPLAALERKYKGNIDNLIANANISYRLIPELQLKTSLGFNTMKMNGFSTSPKSAVNPAYINAVGLAFFANGRINTWIIEPQAEYQRNLGKGRLNILAGTTFQQDIRESQDILGYGYTSDALIENINAAPAIYNSGANYIQYRYNALFGRINYEWQAKYIINLTGRRDGSSRFGPGRQFANFAAFGGAWIFSNENFTQNALSFLSFGKLRGSYGTTGSDQIGDYGYLDSYSSGGTYNGIAGLIPTGLANPDYAWEINKKLEVALNLGFLNDHVLLDVSWYRNRSSNQLVGYSLPAITGFTSIQYNLPAIVQNTGWEFEANTIIVEAKNLKWTSSVNLTIPRNKLIAYPNIEGSSYANTYSVGEPLSIRKIFNYTGIDSQTGLYTFKDLNGDGVSEWPNDLSFSKKITEKFSGGFQNELEYKGVQVSIFFQFVKQTGSDYMGSFNLVGTGANQPIDVMNRWQKPGDIATIQRFTQSYGSPALTTFYNRLDSDNGIIDASFVRLKNLSLSYQLPTKLLEKIKARNARIYLQGQNLFTITKYKGMDPERFNPQVLPPLRTIVAGINFTF